MATVQDRLRQCRTPLDKWSTREQLCLASAVSCSGDQNWMSVSRTMKLVCGSGINSIARPNDWYSQKSCAAQYGQLLENVETPKRKKRTSESSGSESAVDTPTDLVLRKLTEERIQELKDDIRKNQEDYAKIYQEIRELQSGNCSEERLKIIWQELEQEDEAKRIEEQKIEQLMREREQRKQEVQRSWRTTTPMVTVNSPTIEVMATETKVMTTEKPKPATLQIQPDASIQHQPQTSPLLSSLLKSPPGNSPVPNTSTPTNSVRTAAPTITTLLTGGTISNVKQPVVIVKNTEIGQLLKRPISGPPLETIVGAIGSGTTQNLLSPSQSAPTLSMLLEKTKTNQQNNSNADESISSAAAKKPKLDHIEVDVESKQSNNEEAIIEIDEDLTTNTTAAHNTEADETDPNEEQQLLEVFKNIGNIELEIDAEFLNAMEEDPPHDGADIAANFDIKITNSAEAEAIADTVKLQVKNNEQTDIKLEEDKEASTDKFEDVENKLVNDKENEVIAKTENQHEIVNKDIKEKIKTETISSDDSNDNIPLAAVVATNYEGKDRMPTETMEKEQTVKLEITISNENSEVKPKIHECKVVVDKVEMEIIKVPAVDIKDKDERQVEEQKQDKVEEVQLIQVSKLVEHKETKIDAVNKVETVQNKLLEETIPIEKLDESINTINQQTIVTVADTDTEDSYNHENDKTTNIEKSQSHNEGKEDERISESSDSIQISTPAIALTTPARPIALRKLREGDRSESPMACDEETENVTTTSRLRRRGSSTPISESVPNSPASISDRDEKELRLASKKSLLTIFNAMQQKHAKNITLLEQSFSDHAMSVKYEACLRPMDFQVVQERIESGSIRNTLELQRDILLMCQNAIMLYGNWTEQYRAALLIKLDCRNLNDLHQAEKSVSEKEAKEREHTLSNSSSTCSNSSATPNPSGIKARSGCRKSLRIP